MTAKMSAFFCGLLFAAGLALGGMTLPQKVIGFLSLTKSWDPSLMFVMAGAVFTFMIGYRLSVRRKAPLYSDSFHVPTKTLIDRKLIGGAILFGAGWGAAGYCPAPAVVSLVTLEPGVWLFVGAMVVGMYLGRKLTVEAKGNA